MQTSSRYQSATGKMTLPQNLVYQSRNHHAEFDAVRIATHVMPTETHTQKNPIDSENIF